MVLSVKYRYAFLIDLLASSQDVWESEIMGIRMCAVAIIVTPREVTQLSLYIHKYPFRNA